MSEAALDPKAAVSIALSYVNELFAPNKISNLGLEELERVSDEWRVTVGFSRPWDYPKAGRRPPADPLVAALGHHHGERPDRDYKLVRVNALTGEILSVKNRE
jgi:hypothetical protein